MTEHNNAHNLPMDIPAVNNGGVNASNHSENKLTQKQELFCQEYVKSGNAAEAYRKVFNSTSENDNTIYVAACRLLKKTKIKLRIEHLNKKAESRAIISANQVLENLSESASLSLYDENKKLVLGSAQHSNKIRANELLARHYGLLKDKMPEDVEAATFIVMRYNDKGVAVPDKPENAEAAQKFSVTRYNSEHGAQADNDNQGNVNMEGQTNE